MPRAFDPVSSIGMLQDRTIEVSAAEEYPGIWMGFYPMREQGEALANWLSVSRKSFMCIFRLFTPPSLGLDAYIAALH